MKPMTFCKSVQHSHPVKMVLGTFFQALHPMNCPSKEKKDKPKVNTTGIRWPKAGNIGRFLIGCMLGQGHSRLRFHLHRMQTRQ